MNVQATQPALTPRVTSPGRPRIVYSRDESSGAPLGRAGQPRILVVEDDFLVASEIEAELAAAGFDVVATASAADEAVRLALSEEPQLVIMDIRLEGDRDGVDAALEIFHTAGIRCLFASAYQDDATRARAAPAKPLGWLAKPYTLSSLIHAVRAALRTIDT